LYSHFYFRFKTLALIYASENFNSPEPNLASPLKKKTIETPKVIHKVHIKVPNSLKAKNVYTDDSDD